jgi:hypothetical protein
MTSETMLEKIYEKFKKLKDEATEDCKFDRGQIENSFDNTTKLMKWINKKSEWSRVYRTFEIERKDKYRKTYEFYVTDFPMKLNGKDEYQLFIESDPGYLDTFTRCQVVKEILTYVDSVIDTLKSRAWEVKAALDYLKFSNGQ